MHELSLVSAVVRTVEEALPGRRVLRVTLRVGVASGAVPEALAFAWDLAVDGTALAGARLEVEPVPVTVTCPDCGAAGPPADPRRARCAECGSGRVVLRGGRELEIATVEIEDVDDGDVARGEREGRVAMPAEAS